jgi:chorismate mutase
MSPDPNPTTALRSDLDRLDVEIRKLVAERDRVATEVMRKKKTAPYDPVREHEIAGKDEALWLPLLRRVRTAEGASSHS